MEASTNDRRREGERGVAAAFRAWEALNPASPLWAPARNEGVTTVGVAARAAASIAGQGAVVDTAAGTGGRHDPQGAGGDGGQPGVARRREGQGARRAASTRLRQVLDDARVYALEEGGVRERPRSARWPRRPPTSPRCSRCSTGRLPLLVAGGSGHRHRGRARARARLQAPHRHPRRRRGVDGGGAARRRQGARVVTTALDNIPTSFASLGQRQENAALLRTAGVPGRADRPESARRSTSATSASTPATRSPTGCRGTRRCAP